MTSDKNISPDLNEYLNNVPNHLGWKKIESMEDEDNRLKEVESVLKDMPIEHKENLGYLAQFFKKLGIVINLLC